MHMRPLVHQGSHISSRVRTLLGLGNFENNEDVLWQIHTRTLIWRM